MAQPQPNRRHCFFPQQDAEKYAELKKKRTFKKFTYRGIELEGLLDLSNEELAQILPKRARRKFSRGNLNFFFNLPSDFMECRFEA